MACASTSAFANATAYNGFMQTSGNGGVDLSNLDGGSYRVTMTQSGQLNFRYTFGNEVFDSNPEAALHSRQSAYAERSDLTAYSTSGGASVATPYLPAPYVSYGVALPLLTSKDPMQYLATVSQDVDSGASSSPSTFPTVAPTFAMGAAAFDSSVVDVASLQPLTYYVPPYSAYAFVSMAGVPVLNDAYAPFEPMFGVEENPEPATFALAAGALLLGLGMVRRRSRTA